MHRRHTFIVFSALLMLLSACAVDAERVVALPQRLAPPTSEAAIASALKPGSFDDASAESASGQTDPSPGDDNDGNASDRPTAAEPSEAPPERTIAEPTNPVAVSSALDVGFASWDAPADDPIQLIQRIESPYFISDLADTLAAQSPNDARCLTQPMVPAAVAFVREETGYEPAMDYVLAIHHSPAEAAVYAADYAAAASACNPTAAGTILATEFTDTDLDLSNFRAWDIADDTGTVTTTILTTHHGALSASISLERREAPGDGEYVSINQKLERIIDSLRLAPIEPPASATWFPEGDFEDYMLETLGLWSHRLSDDDKQCLLTNIEEYSSGGTEYLSYVIVQKLAGWCAPVPTYVEGNVDNPGLAKTLLTDIDQQRCFLIAKAEYGARGTFVEFLDRSLNKPAAEAWAPERIALDARLSEECGIDEELAIRAGLDPRTPLDESPERQAYCDAYNTPLVRALTPPNATEVEENLSYLRDVAETQRARVAPPEITDALARVVAWYDFQIDLIETTGRSQVDLYSDPTYLAKKNELKPDQAHYETSEYVRVNC